MATSRVMTTTAEDVAGRSSQLFAWHEGPADRKISGAFVVSDNKRERARYF
jgi:hypothetical protein